MSRPELKANACKTSLCLSVEHLRAADKTIASHIKAQTTVGFPREADARAHLDFGPRTRAALEREKALALRSLKELEFDRAMGKVSEADFAEVAERLRARAMRVMQQLDGEPPR